MSMLLCGAGGAGLPFTPAAISGLTIWLDASQLTGLSDGNAISSWTDFSGGSHHAVQASGTRQPLYKTNIQNGKPVVRFDGSNDSIATPSFTFNNPLTVFVVANITVVAATNRFLIDGATDLSTPMTYNGTSSLLAAAPMSVTITGGVWHAHCLIVKGANSTLRTDGGSPSTGTHNGNPSGLTIGSEADLSAFTFLGGDVAEVLAYNSALSDADRGLVEAYLRAKWATP